MPSTEFNREYLGYEHISDLSSSTALSSIPVGTEIAYLQAIGGAANFQGDGTAATGADNGGYRIPSGQEKVYASQFANLRFIQVTGETAKLNVLYFGRRI